MKFIHLIVILIGAVIASFTLPGEDKEVKQNKPINFVGWKTSSLEMYFAIKKYCQKYDIPEDIAFSFAWHETRYGGPNHKEYNHKLISHAGALGPMQIMPVAGRNFCPGKYSDSLLLHDVNYNIATSMKLIRYLKDRFGSWELAAGAYNTGRPIVNDYARGVSRGYYVWL